MRLAMWAALAWSDATTYWVSIVAVAGGGVGLGLELEQRLCDRRARLDEERKQRRLERRQAGGRYPVNREREEAYQAALDEALKRHPSYSGSEQ